MAKGGGHSKGQTMPYSSIRAFSEKKPMRAGHWSLFAAQSSIRDSLVAANARDLDLEASVIDRATGETVWQPAKCGVCRTAWATEAVHGADEWTVCRGCEDMAAEPDVDGAGRTLAEYRQPPAAGLVAPEPLSRPIPVMAQPGSTAALLAEREVESDPQLVAAEAMHGQVIALEPLYADCLKNSPDADPSGLIEALDRLNLPRAVWSDGTVVSRANGILWRMRAEPHAVTGRPCGVWSVWGPAGCRGHFVADKAARFIRDRTTA